MVCGRCHRERTDHTLSSSGPTRCEYTSHRENCPGGFKSKCFEQQNLESETEYNDTDNEDFVQPSDTMQDILTGLKSLKLHSDTQNDVQPPFNDQLQQLGLSPLQVQQLFCLASNLVRKTYQKRIKPLPPKLLSNPFNTLQPQHNQRQPPIWDPYLLDHQ